MHDTIQDVWQGRFVCNLLYKLEIFVLHLPYFVSLFSTANLLSIDIVSLFSFLLVLSHDSFLLAQFLILTFLPILISTFQNFQHFRRGKLTIYLRLTSLIILFNEAVTI